MNEAEGSAGRQFGKYQLIAHLATGGMAEVLLASQSGLADFEKLIVIKRILPHLAREQKFIEMFLDEARIAAMLNHPNVVQVFDLGRVQGRYFIAMEYLPGESLSTLVRACRKRGSAIPPHLAAGMVLQAADGLQHAHTAVGKDGRPLDIVHRDVSPHNIFVLYDGGVKVVDFGIAKAALRSTQTQTGMLKGKFPYMSPEQILAEDLDARSDVFSLGVVLWECLTGRKLFPHKSELKLMKAITGEERPSPAEINPDVPMSLADVSLEALARDREKRFQSAAEFRAALADFLRDESAQADSAAIGRFMHETFAERISNKRRQLEDARRTDRDLQEFLFGDITELASDTEASVPRTPLDGLVPPEATRAPTAAERPGRMIHPGVPATSDLRVPRRRASILLTLVVVIALAGASVYLLLNRATGERKAPAPDAGVLASVAPVSTVDAPSDFEGSPPAAQPEKGPVNKKPKRRKKRRKLVRVNRPKPPARPDPKPDPEPGGTGTLRLTTDPWTNIYLEGKKIGQTPLVDIELPAGKLRLRAVNQEDGIDQIIIIRIKPGKHTVRRFNFF